MTRTRIAALAAVPAAALVLVAAQALAGTKELTGQLTSHAVAEGCASPIGLCTAGRLVGGINGDLEFTCTITGGTGDYAGASGAIRIAGVFTFAGGGDSGYRARVTTP